MESVSSRLGRRIASDFPDPGSAEEVTRLVARASDSERIQAAIVFAAQGDPREVLRQVELSQVDWRDVLVNGGLENEDWPALLDQQLGR
ncbi:hypothetical protein C3E87_04500 [Tessaracoccus sp. ZS01]|nr:hypothetical protein [Tessaracoccus sp. ZS01]OMG58023.1 hypothetical protein BJN44_04515 [Tessaracoccus sp. ZS01]